MESYVVYVADDGREFDDEEECAEYERSISYESIEGQYQLFDNEMKSMKFVDGDTCFIKAFSGKACKVLKHNFDECGLVSPWDRYMGELKPGCWYYNQYEDRWFPLEPEINRWKEIEEKVFLS